MCRGRATAWGVLVALAAVAPMSGCETKSRASTVQTDSSHVRRATGFCTDSTESRALNCSGHTARRAGDTLVIHLASNRDTALVNVVGETDEIYQYVGRIGRAGF